MRTRIYTAFGHRFYDLSAFIRVRPRPIYKTVWPAARSAANARGNRSAFTST